MEKLTLTMRDVCDELHASRPTVYQWMRSEGLPYIRVGRKLLFPLDSVREWMAAREEVTKA